MRAISNFTLSMGKLKLPLACYKTVDNTTSVRASEVTKINDKVYKVQRKPFVVLEDGTEQDIDSTQILKAYERDDGETALFTKEEQNQLLKAGSSREWNVDVIVDKSKFHDLSFQKDGIIAMVDLDKKKELLNKKNLKFYAMLKEGLKDKVMVTQILYKNTEFPVAIMNHGDKLLIRFCHYKGEVRSLESQDVPELSAEEKKQAVAFAKQFIKPDFDLDSYENRTQEAVLKLVNSRGTDVEPDNSKVELSEVDNPFI